MTAEEMEALQKALYAAIKVENSLKAQRGTVTREDGLAVFRNLSGVFLGAMNWDDYEAAVAEQKRQKAGR